MKNTANPLKMQLKSAQAELEQTRTALKTMEGSDGNGNYGLSFCKLRQVCLFNKRVLVIIDPSIGAIIIFQILCAIIKYYYR